LDGDALKLFSSHLSWETLIKLIKVLGGQTFKFHFHRLKRESNQRRNCTSMKYQFSTTSPAFRELPPATAKYVGNRKVGPLAEQADGRPPGRYRSLYREGDEEHGRQQVLPGVERPLMAPVQRQLGRYGREVVDRPDVRWTWAP